MEKVNLDERFATFDDVYVPRVVGELNGQYVKVVKFQGEYPWHEHEHEDEMFLVMHGRIRLDVEGRKPVWLGPGEFLVVPRGVRHRPAADDVAHVVLFEPASTRNTGDVDHDYTIEPDQLERL